MALAPASSGKEPVVPEVEMNGGADQPAATTVRATVVQASSVFYDTPATLGACNFSLRSPRLLLQLLEPISSAIHAAIRSRSRLCGYLHWFCEQGVCLSVLPKLV
jgi:hypothetical protein